MRLIHRLCFSLPLFVVSFAPAADVPAHAEGLRETLISVSLSETSQQQGVLSLKADVSTPSHLAVLLPGSPSIVRPVIEGNSMVRSKLTGNFLIRSRRHLADAQIATLIVDCPSDAGEECQSFYQSSAQRHQDVSRLIAAVRKELPSIRSVWLVGTSMGTISSAHMARHGSDSYQGAIHTATMTQPYLPGAYREMAGFDYGAIKIPQAFVHHVDDPCRYTPHDQAVLIADKYDIPLLTVRGGGDYTGPPCQAQSAHGFKGMEKAVMRAIARIIVDGKASRQDIVPEATESPAQR